MAKPWEKPASFFVPRDPGFLPLDPPPTPPTPPKPNGLLRDAGDLGLSLAKGGLGATKAITDVFGADNAVSRSLAGGIENVSDWQSEEQQALRQAHAQRMAEAEQQGTGAEIAAGWNNFWENPLNYTFEGLGSVATVAPIGLIAKGAQVAGIGARGAALTGIGAAQGVGAVKGSQFDHAYRAETDNGAKPEAARAAARQAQAYSSDNAVDLLTGGALGVAAGRLGAESYLLGGARGLAKRSITGRAAVGIATEAPIEGAQGGQERLAANRALERMGYDVDVWQGVGGQATSEALMSAPVGGGLAAARGYVPTSEEITAREQEQVELAAAAVRAQQVAQEEQAAMEKAAQDEARRVDLRMRYQPQFSDIKTWTKQRTAEIVEQELQPETVQLAYDEHRRDMLAEGKSPKPLDAFKKELAGRIAREQKDMLQGEWAAALDKFAEEQERATAEAASNFAADEAASYRIRPGLDIPGLGARNDRNIEFEEFAGEEADALATERERLRTRFDQRPTRPGTPLVPTDIFSEAETAAVPFSGVNKQRSFGTENLGPSRTPILPRSAGVATPGPTTSGPTTPGSPKPPKPTKPPKQPKQSKRAQKAEAIMAAAADLTDEQQFEVGQLLDQSKFKAASDLAEFLAQQNAQPTQGAVNEDQTPVSDVRDADQGQQVAEETDENADGQETGKNADGQEGLLTAPAARTGLVDTGSRPPVASEVSRLIGGLLASKVRGLRPSPNEAALLRAYAEITAEGGDWQAATGDALVQRAGLTAKNATKQLPTLRKRVAEKLARYAADNGVDLPALMARAQSGEARTMTEADLGVEGEAAGSNLGFRIDSPADATNGGFFRSPEALRRNAASKGGVSEKTAPITNLNARTIQDERATDAFIEGKPVVLRDAAGNITETARRTDAGVRGKAGFELETPQTDPVGDAKRADLHARREAELDRALQSPMATEAFVAWEATRGPDDVPASALTSDDAKDWLLSYAEWTQTNNDRVLADDRRTIESRYIRIAEGQYARLGGAGTDDTGGAGALGLEEEQSTADSGREGGGTDAGTDTSAEDDATPADQVADPGERETEAAEGVDDPAEDVDPDATLEIEEPVSTDDIPGLLTRLREIARADKTGNAKSYIEDIKAGRVSIDEVADWINTKTGASKFSVAGTATESIGQSVADLRSKLRATFRSPAFMDRAVSIVRNGDDPTLPADVRRQVQSVDGGRVQGLYDPGTKKVWLLADNIPAGKELGVVLHEVGVHMGMENLLGKAAYDRLLAQVQQWSRAGGSRIEHQLAAKAAARVAGAEEAAGAQSADELLAYFVEEAVNAGIDPTAVKGGSPALREWFRRLWAAAKGALRRLGMDSTKLSAEDVVALAYGAARMEMAGSWHGTAADFRRFDHAYMNTGEGAQAFGWGTYLAQRLGIAKGYWRQDTDRKYGQKAEDRVRIRELQERLADAEGQLAAPPISLDTYRTVSRNGRVVEPREWDDTGAESMVAYRLLYDGDDFSTVVKAVEGSIHDMENDSGPLPALRAELQAMREDEFSVGLSEESIAEARRLHESSRQFWMERVAVLKRELAEIASPRGNLMRVDVAVAEDEFLDWDKPLSEQSEKVKATLLAASPLQAEVDRRNAEREAMNAKNPRRLTTPQIAKVAGRAVTAERFKGKDIYDVLTKALGSDKAASEYLDSIGVKGIKFLDQPSRNAADGAAVTRNIVVFNDKNIQRIFSEPGADRTARKFSLAANAVVNAYPESAKAKAKWAQSNVMSALRTGENWLLFTNSLVKRAVDSGLTSAQKWYDAVNARETARIQHLKGVDDVADAVDKLGQREFNRTWGLVLDSTAARKWAYQPTWRGAVQVDPAMRARYDALSQKEKDIVDAVFRQGNETQSRMNATMTTIADDLYAAKLARATSQAAKDKIAKEKARFLRAYGKKTASPDFPYAPMRRVGNYATVGKSARYQALAEQAKTNTKAQDALLELRKDPAHYLVMFSDSQGEADFFAGRMQTAGLEAVAAPKEKITSADMLPFEPFEKLREMAASESGTGTGKLLDMIDELYLATLAESSARQSDRTRLAVGGLNADTMYKAFLSKGAADAHYLSVLETHQSVSREFAGMREEAGKFDAGRGKRREMFNELKSRYDNSFNYDPSPLANRLMNLGTYWHLLLKPAYYVYNLTQPVMMTLPYLTKQHSYTKAAREMSRAYKDLLGTAKALSLDEFRLELLPADVRGALIQLRDTGLIDITITQDIGKRIGQRRGSSASRVLSTVDRTIRTVAQKTEMANRIVTGVAAYRLAMAKNPGKPEAALAYAREAVEQTQGNYSNFNAPRLFNQNDTMRVVTQFKKFQFIQAGMMIGMVKGAATGNERAANMRALRYIMLHHAAFAGALGFPAFNIIAMAFAMSGDDDEPRNLDLWLKQNLGDDSVGRVLRYGAPAAFGLNMSGNIGMGQTFSVIPFADVKPTRAGYDSIVTSLGGPVIGGLLPQFYTAIAGKGGDGDYYGMLAGLMPGAVKTSMQAVAEASEGVKSPRGDVLVQPDDVVFGATLARSLGFNTVDATVRRLVNNNKYEFEAFFTARQRELKKTYAKAHAEGDGTALAEARQDWGEMQQFMKSAGIKPPALSVLLKAPRDAAERARNTIGGVQFTRRNEEFVEENVAQ